MKFDYGETYGNATAKYFQDYRSRTLNSSRSSYATGGYFPTYYTHEPKLAVEARTRNWQKWVDPPTIRLYNQDHDRQDELHRFRQVNPFQTYSKLSILTAVKGPPSNHLISSGFVFRAAGTILELNIYNLRAV